MRMLFSKKDTDRRCVDYGRSDIGGADDLVQNPATDVEKFSVSDARNSPWIPSASIDTSPWKHCDVPSTELTIPENPASLPAFTCDPWLFLPLSISCQETAQRGTQLESVARSRGIMVSHPVSHGTKRRAQVASPLSRWRGTS